MSASSSPGRSAAVLMGVSTYEHLDDLPGVRGSATDLAAQLCDPAIWGLPADRCHLVMEPDSPTAAFAPLRALGGSGLDTLDTLVVYYAGHGLIDPLKGDLWLGLPGSVTGRPDTCVPYEWLRQELLGLRVERRIVILDCCYSGRALGLMGGAQAAVANGAVVEGTYLIASAGESAQALAPPGARHTAFTGELISLLARGVPDGPELFHLDAVFQHLSEALRARSCPEPQKRVRNTAGQLPLFRNRAYVPRGPGHLLSDRYELGPPLRGDSLTDTYRAVDTALDRPVRIKLMKPEAAADSWLSDGFRSRAKSRAALRHPRVASLHDIGMAVRQGVHCPYLVTEDITDPPLTALVKDHLPHPAWVIQVVSELLGVLEHAHGLGVFGWHIDLESIAFTADNHIKVVDLDDAPDGRGDLLAAGGLLHELLTGHPPLTQSVPRQMSPPSAELWYVSDAVDGVVLKALANDPADRYQSAAEMWQAVEGLRGRETRPASGPGFVEPRSLSMHSAAGSHAGLVRKQNQDSGYAGPRLLALADGIEGRAAGEVASSEVIATLVSLDDDVPGSDLLTTLGAAAQRANDQLRMMAEEDPRLEGMGTTLTALLWTGTRLGLLHIGNSRAYLLRDGALTQITQDHTWARQLADEGRITEAEILDHPQRSALRRALGDEDHVEPDLAIREVRAGDRYLVCTAGLFSAFSEEQLEDALASYQPPQETVQELVRLALRGGGPDNITCIVADIIDVAVGDTGAGQFDTTPVVVGAVAESQGPTG
ncbi:protein phosphatase 2C domain-containing protein [Streptomyces sp. NPDC048172]|uniref:caspase, EACC1-associated type n=1 Tax=Streptomyces sp. NPDC048172 TaxID=3365505 RepID=UPI003714FF5B